MAEPKEEPVYVGLYTPTDVRKSLLESTKAAIQILQSNEEFKKTKIQKQELEQELQEIMRDLTKLVARIKSQWPKVKLSSLPKKPSYETSANIIEQEIEITKEEEEPVQEIMEEEKLEHELKEIEEKLKRL